MLDAHGLGDLLGHVFSQKQPLKAGILDPLAKKLGVVVQPKLGFPKTP